MSITAVKEEREDDLISRKVSMTVFTWVIGLLVTMFSLGMIYTMNTAQAAEKRALAAEAKVEALDKSIQPVNIAIAQIQANLEWIRRQVDGLAAREVTRR